MSTTKNVLLNWYSSMKKKLRKIWMIFWYRKLTLKVKRLGDFSLFDTSPLVQFSKFKNFLWVCWFLGKNLSNFLPPVWKLHNPYCHNLRTKALSCCLFLHWSGKTLHSLWLSKTTSIHEYENVLCNTLQHPHPSLLSIGGWKTDHSPMLIDRVRKIESLWLYAMASVIHVRSEDNSMPKHTWFHLSGETWARQAK